MTALETKMRKLRRLFIAAILGVAYLRAFAAPSAMEIACARIVANSPRSDARALMAHAIGQGLDMSSIRRRLEELSGARPLPDGTYLKERGSSEGRMIARLRIYEALKTMGLSPAFENFPNGSNVVAEIPGSLQPERVLELTAHYDSVGNPGADDNGSGVALLLELASYLQGFHPEITIRFVFMDLEEKGKQGSEHHARKISRDATQEIVGVIVIDTIGWAPKDAESFLAVVEVGEARDQRSTQAYAIQEYFAAEMFYLIDRIGARAGIAFSPELNGAKPGTADHGSYWHEGIPAILIAAPFESGYINPEYHKNGDTTENMNWTYYELVSRIIAELAAFKAGAALTLSVEEITRLTGLENPEVQVDLATLHQSVPRPRNSSRASEPATGNNNSTSFSAIFSSLRELIGLRN